MHFTKLADARSLKACRAWHTGKDCLNDCFHFAMQGLHQAFKRFCVFLEKGGNLKHQDFKQEHCFVQILTRVIQKVQRKEEVCF